jgi:hypothetical protein
MALFGLFKNEATKRREFAEQLRSSLVQAGQAGPWSYAEGDFSLRSATSVLFLERVWAEVQRTAPAERAAVLAHWLAGAKVSAGAPAAVPVDRASLLASLRPMLRDRGWLELSDVDHRRVFGSPIDEVPHAVVAEHFAVTLVAWQPHAMATVTSRALTEAGVSTDEAFAAAGANLRALAPGFRELRRGLWVSVEEDDFDASRLLLNRVRQLDVRGAPVALAANRNALFVTGEKDDDGLELLAEVAAKELAEERSLAPLLLRHAGDWEPWLPPPGSRHHALFRRWQLKATLDRYNRQKAELEALEKHVGEGKVAHALQDYFYASVQVRVPAPEDWAAAQTLCHWFPIRSLLPRVDLLCLRAEQDGPIVAVRWHDALERVGDLMQRVDAYPERWRVERFPDARQLDALRAVQVDLGS